MRSVAVIIAVSCLSIFSRAAAAEEREFHTWRTRTNVTVVATYVSSRRDPALRTTVFVLRKMDGSEVELLHSDMDDTTKSLAFRLHGEQQKREKDQTKKQEEAKREARIKREKGIRDNVVAVIKNNIPSLSQQQQTQAKQLAGVYLAEKIELSIEECASVSKLLREDLKDRDETEAAAVAQVARKLAVAISSEDLAKTATYIRACFALEVVAAWPETETPSVQGFDQSTLVMGLWMLDRCSGVELFPTFPYQTNDSKLRERINSALKSEPAVFMQVMGSYLKQCNSEIYQETKEFWYKKVDLACDLSIAKAFEETADERVRNLFVSATERVRVAQKRDFVLATNFLSEFENAYESGDRTKMQQLRMSYSSLSSTVGSVLQNTGYGKRRLLIPKSVEVVTLDEVLSREMKKAGAK